MVRVARFELTASWSRTMRATNCATPGYEVVGWPGRILPKLARYQLRNTPVNFDYTMAERDSQPFLR